MRVEDGARLLALGVLAMRCDEPRPVKLVGDVGISGDAAPCNATANGRVEPGRRVTVCTRPKEGAPARCDGWVRAGGTGANGAVTGTQLHAVARLQSTMNTIPELLAEPPNAGGTEYVPDDSTDRAALIRVSETEACIFLVADSSKPLKEP